MPSEQPEHGLNQGDNTLGIDLDDETCPDCGREIQRKMFSYRAYCPVCDTIVGRLKRRLGLTDKKGGCDV